MCDSYPIASSWSVISKIDFELVLISWSFLILLFCSYDSYLVRDSIRFSYKSKPFNKSYVTMGTTVDKYVITFEGRLRFWIGIWTIICNWSTILSNWETDPPINMFTKNWNIEFIWMKFFALFEFLTKLILSSLFFNYLTILCFNFLNLGCKFKPVIDLKMSA